MCQHHQPLSSTMKEIAWERVCSAILDASHFFSLILHTVCCIRSCCSLVNYPLCDNINHWKSWQVAGGDEQKPAVNIGLEELFLHSKRCFGVCVVVGLDNLRILDLTCLLRDAEFPRIIMKSSFLLKGRPLSERPSPVVALQEAKSFCAFYGKRLPHSHSAAFELTWLCVERDARRYTFGLETYFFLWSNKLFFIHVVCSRWFSLFNSCWDCTS